MRKLKFYNILHDFFISSRNTTFKFNNANIWKRYQVDQSLQYQEERFMVYAFYGPVTDTNTGVTLCIQNQTKTQNLKAFIINLLLK